MENLPERPSLDSALYPQICSCPGYANVSSRAPAAFWSSLLGADGFLNCTFEQAAEHSGLTLAETRRFYRESAKLRGSGGTFSRLGLAESLIIQLRRAGA